MGVYQRAERGNAWYYRFKIDKRTFKEKCLMPDGKPAANRFEALQCERAARDTVFANAPRPNYAPAANIRPADVTLEEAFAWHVARIKDETTPGHLAAFARHAREALAFFGEGRRLLSITDMDLLDFRAAVSSKKRRLFVGGQSNKNPDLTDETLWKEIDKQRGPAEKNHVLNALRCAFKAAYRMRDSQGRPMIPYLPVIERFHNPQRRPTPMSSDELNRRRAVAAPWVQDAMDLARHFGLRISETLKVRARHVDYDNRTISFRGEEVKSKNDQACHSTPEGWEVVRRLMKQARERGVDYLITYPGKAAHKIRGSGKRASLADVPADSIEWRPLKSIRRAWKGSARLAGIETPRRFHDLRAAYITEVAKHEKSGKKIQGIARHASFTTTERYIDIADSELVGVMDNVAKARRGKSLILPAPANSSGTKRPTPAKRHKAR